MVVFQEDITTSRSQSPRAGKSQMVERLEYELGIIGKMGYDGYFLITADLINWARTRAFIFAWASSAAGSIVAIA